MNKIIHRHELDLNAAEFTITMHAGARILRVEVSKDPGVVELWALEDIDQPRHVRTFDVVGTGQPLKPAPDTVAVHVGTTTRHPTTGLVWHVFEVHPV